jgi:hypothetical protein
MNILFGLSLNIFKTIPLDLNMKEVLLYFGVVILMF